MSTLKEVSATGDVITGARRILSVTLTPAAAASAVEVRDASGGAIVLTLKAPASGGSVTWRPGDAKGIPVGTSVHATLTGAGALASFEYSTDLYH